MMRNPHTRYITIQSNYNVQQYQIDSSVRSSLRIISQSEPEIPKLNSCCAVSCRFHYTSMLHENHLSKTCFTRAKGVLSLHFVLCFVLLFFHPLSKLNFCCVVSSRKCLMNMSTCSLCPSCIMLLRRAALLFFFFFARVLVGCQNTTVFVQIPSRGQEAFSDDPQCAYALLQIDFKEKKNPGTPEFSFKLLQRAP